MSILQNQVAPFEKKDSSFSPFNKFKLRERLGIKQFIKESDIEEFKKEGVNTDHLEPTPTPKSLMMMKWLQVFRRYLIVGVISVSIYFRYNFEEKGMNWL